MIDLIKVYRYELYPNDEPTSYWVGFAVTIGQHQPFIMDTKVSFEDAEGLEEAAIVDLAYNNLKSAINTRAAELEAKSPIVGSEYTPPAE